MNRPLSAIAMAALLVGAGPLLSPVRAAASEETTAPAGQTPKAWRDPSRFEHVIAAYESEHTTAPKGAIIGYGSSSMRGWHKTIAEDLAPLTIVPRGFGGSTMNDAVHFMDRVILPLKPRAVLLYEGDNDVADRHPTEQIVSKYREFLTRLHKALPETRVYILSVKPSILRWKMWPAMQELNEELKKLAEADPRVTYIDVGTPMLGPDGKPRPDIFQRDKLHMNRKGYEIWRDTVRPVLLEKEKDAETE